MQTQYLTGLLETASEFGLPIDSESEPYGNTGASSCDMVFSFAVNIDISSLPAAWSLFASAFVSNTTVRDNLIKSIHNHANSNVSYGLFAEIYNTSYNSYEHGAAG